MTVIIRGIDLTELVHGGSYSQKKTIGNLRNLPDGPLPATSGIVPIPFGIIVNNIDLCNYYTAKYSDHVSSGSATFPSWCTSFRVICIGGGGGGTGGTAPVNNTINASLPGYAGSGGNNGGVSSGSSWASGSGTYSFTIGGGGAGGAGGITANTKRGHRGQGPGVLTIGKPGTAGTVTSFSATGFTLSSSATTNNSLVPTVSGYGAGGAGGDDGAGGDGGAGGNGGAGICRVYFFR